MGRWMLAALVLCFFAMPVAVEAKSKASSSKSSSSGNSSGTKSGKSSHKAGTSSKRADKSSKNFGSFSSHPKPTPSTSSSAAASPSKTAAFGSFGNGPKPTPSVSPNTPTSTLSSDLSKRSAQAAALNTLDAGNQQANTQHVASPGTNYPATRIAAPPNAPGTQAPVYANNPVPQQQPNYNGGGGSDHSFLWYMLGRESGEHDRDNHVAQTVPSASPIGNNAAPAPGAQSAQAVPSRGNESLTLGGVLLWFVITMLLVGLGYYVFKRVRNTLSPKEEQAGNYTL